MFNEEDKIPVVPTKPEINPDPVPKPFLPTVMPDHPPMPEPDPIPQSDPVKL